MDTIVQVLNALKINPENPEWTAAIIAFVALMSQGFTFIIQSFKTYQEMKGNRISEENNTFMSLRRDFDYAWFNLTKNSSGILYKDFSDLMSVLKNEELVEEKKTLIFQIIKLLSDIHFIYADKNQSKYWRRWEYIFHHTFSRNLFQSAFIKYKRFHSGAFVSYVDSVIEEEKAKIKEEKIKKVA